MTNKNQSCGVGQDSMPSMTCLIHVLEAWFGVEHLEDYWNFANYLLWVFTPLLLLILPYFTIFLLYLTIVFLHIYKRKNVLKEAYSHNLWDGARKTVATLWDGHAAIWHGKQITLCSGLLLVWVHWHPIIIPVVDWRDVEKYDGGESNCFLLSVCMCGAHVLSLLKLFSSKHIRFH